MRHEDEHKDKAETFSTRNNFSASKESRLAKRAKSLVKEKTK